MNMNMENREELQRLARLSADEIGMNENSVKYNFIIPFLESFGFNKKFDFEHSSQGNRIDILIDKISDYSVLVEAKSYGKNLDDYITQLKRYCDEKRPIIAIICNGEEIRFYSPFWRKSDFSDTLIYSINRTDLLDDDIIDRISTILLRTNLESGSIIRNIENREKEISNINEQIAKIETQSKEDIAKKDETLKDIESQIKSLESKLDSIKSEISDIKSESHQKVEELKKKYFIFISQPKPPITTVVSFPKPSTGRRPLGRKGYEQLRDYLIPIIKLIKSGVNHTDAFHKVANELDVTYQTANAQCTVRLGKISTVKFVELIKTNQIKNFLKEYFPDKVELIEREL